MKQVNFYWRIYKDYSGKKRSRYNRENTDFSRKEVNQRYSQARKVVVHWRKKSWAWKVNNTKGFQKTLYFIEFFQMTFIVLCIFKLKLRVVTGKPHTFINFSKFDRFFCSSSFSERFTIFCVGLWISSSGWCFIFSAPEISWFAWQRVCYSCI